MPWLAMDSRYSPIVGPALQGRGRVREELVGPRGRREGAAGRGYVQERVTSQMESGLWAFLGGHIDLLSCLVPRGRAISSHLFITVYLGCSRIPPTVIEWKQAQMDEWAGKSWGYEDRPA